MVRATYWAGWVEYNESGSSCSVFGSSLTKAIEDGIKTATYYAGNGHQPVIKLVEMCADCRGSGRISTGKHFATKRCRYCCGKGELQRMPDIRFNVHSNTTIHN